MSKTALLLPSTRQRFFRANITDPSSEEKELDGKVHKVFKVVMAVEGVMNGLLYPEEELAKFPGSWNGEPVTVNHPVNVNGGAVSANSPDMLNNIAIGKMFNVAYDGGKLTGEAWIDPEAAKAKGYDDIVAHIEGGGTMEVSTGLYLDMEVEGGVFNGTPYHGIARNFRPDHLAFLPDTEGACSVAEGCGVTANCEEGGCDCEGACKRGLEEERGMLWNEFKINESYGPSFNAIRDQLRTLLRERLGTDPWVWVEDVFTGHVVYSVEGEVPFFVLSYSVGDEGLVALGSEDPKEVIPTKEYKTLNGNHAKTKENMKPKGKPDPEKGDGKNDPPVTNEAVAGLADALIANKQSPFKEGDKETLIAFGEERLGNMLADIKANATLPPEDGSEGAPASNSLSDEERELLDEAKAERKAKLDRIRANVKEHYDLSDELVSNMKPDTLRGLAEKIPPADGASEGFEFPGGGGDLGNKGKPSTNTSKPYEPVGVLSGLQKKEGKE